MTDRPDDLTATPIVDLFAIPPMLIGAEPEFRGPAERGEYLLAIAEASGFDPLGLGVDEVDAAFIRRYEMLARGGAR